MASSFIHVLILLGGFQGLLIGLVHVVRPPGFPWGRFLGYTLSIHALSDVYLWLYWTKTEFNWQLLILLPMNLVLLPVYFLFRYVRGFTGADAHWRFFSLFLAICASLELVAYLLPAGAATYRGSIDQSVHSFAKLIRNTLTAGTLPVVLATCVVLYRIIRAYQQAVGTSVDGRERVSWLFQLLGGLCVVYALAQLPLMGNWLMGVSSRAMFYPLGIGSSLFLAWAGIRAFVVHERLTISNVPGSSVELDAPSAQAILYARAQQLIEAERLYRQHNLKLSDVAGRLSVSPHHLSRVVNQQAATSFTDLINAYRVEEVKRLMTDPAYTHFTLEGLGLEAGFGAKSTYQAAFKKLTGFTPSHYRASNRPAS